MRLVACGALVGLVACSSGGTPARQAAPSRSAGADVGQPSAPAPTAASGAPSSAGTPAATGPAGASGPAVAPSRSATSAPASAAAQPSGVRVAATVSPACVRPGDTATLTVRTEPGAGIGYQAVYSDGASGAAAPFGRGYGGNDKGKADDGGTFVSTWVVSNDAPRGRARVDVVVGWNAQWGSATPSFTVGC